MNCFATTSRRDTVQSLLPIASRLSSFGLNAIAVTCMRWRLLVRCVVGREAIEQNPRAVLILPDQDIAIAATGRDERAVRLKATERTCDLPSLIKCGVPPGTSQRINFRSLAPLTSDFESGTDRDAQIYRSDRSLLEMERSFPSCYRAKQSSRPCCSQPCIGRRD